MRGMGFKWPPEMKKPTELVGLGFIKLMPESGGDAVLRMVGRVSVEQPGAEAIQTKGGHHQSENQDE